MEFRSKVDAWIALLLVASAGVSVAAAARAAADASGAGLIGLAMLLLGAGLPLWVLASTRYTVDGKSLRIRSGPFRWQIPLADIRTVSPTRSLLSAPALSLDRLRIDHGRARVLMVSPTNEAAFLHAIGQADESAPASKRSEAEPQATREPGSPG